MRRQLLPAVRMVLLMTVLTGLLYTATVTVFAQAVFGDRADGSLLTVEGALIGSDLIGQEFASPRYFHSRPSAVGYDASASGGSNLGLTNPVLAELVSERESAYRALNELDPDDVVPIDAVTASGSGLDPHISVANARLQAGRVAIERGIAPERVLELIDQRTIASQFGFMSQEVVSVLALNLELDDLEIDQ